MKNSLPEIRRKKLRELLSINKNIRVMEASNGLTGLIVENTKVDDKEYDAMWLSSLCDSTLKGKPDNEVVDFTSRVKTIEEIFEVTTKPLIVDGDGALIMHMGGLAVAIQNAKDNFKYILINNGCHESVGGQSTIAYDINIEKILLGFGFNKVFTVNNKKDIIASLKEQRENSKIAIIINTNDKSRKDLGRPTTSPIYNKEQFQKKIRCKDESNNI